MRRTILLCSALILQVDVPAGMPVPEAATHFGVTVANEAQVTEVAELRSKRSIFTELLLARPGRTPG